MKYPEFLKKNDTIGLVAPSFGVSGFPYEDKYLSARGKFEDSGFSFVEARHLRGIRHARSASARIRARELMEMYLREDVDFVESVAGGELMLEILPYLNIEKLRKAKPKWFMGISDNTVFTYALTVLCDIASIYGPCLGSFGMRKWDRSIKEAYEIINGQRLKQKSYAKYELPENSKMSDDPLSGYYKTEPVVYHSLDGNDVTMKGRLVGGCLDILLNICGTRFDRVREFGEKYRDWRNYSISYYCYRGGAHGYSTLSLIVFDRKSGEVITEDNLFADGWLAPVSGLMQERVMEELQEEVREFVQKEGIVPNANFSVSEDGVEWLFQPDDILPHAFGPLTVTLSWKELKPYLR